MIRIVVAILVTVVSTSGAAQTERSQQLSGEMKLQKYSLFRTTPTLKKIGQVYYVDVLRPFVFTDDVAVLDPDDETASTEPGPVLEIKIGEKDGKDVWLKLKLLESGDEQPDFEPILRGSDFYTLKEFLQDNGSTDKLCAPGKGRCVKTCVWQGVPWCCKQSC